MMNAAVPIHCSPKMMGFREAHPIRLAKAASVAPHLLLCKKFYPCPASPPVPNIALKDRSGPNMMRLNRAPTRGQAAEEIPMYQRALPVQHPRFVPPELLAVHKPLNARRLLRAVVEHSLLILRRLGEFFAAGGPLS
jgi:hypothetical protein